MEEVKVDMKNFSMFATTLVICLVAYAASAVVVQDGYITQAEYGAAPLALQTVPTSFWDDTSTESPNNSELDALYAVLNGDGSLDLGITGELGLGFGPGGINGMVILLDSRAGGAIASTDMSGFGTIQNNVPGVRTNDFGGFQNGAAFTQGASPGGVPIMQFPDAPFRTTSTPSIFDPGFNPDFAIEMGGVLDYYPVADVFAGVTEVNIVDLDKSPTDAGAVIQAGYVAAHDDEIPYTPGLLDGAAPPLLQVDGVSSITDVETFDIGARAALAGATGPDDPTGTITVAFDAHIDPGESTMSGTGVFGFGQFTPNILGDPSNVTTGFEFHLDADFLDNDGQDIKVMVYLVNGTGAFLSNQFLIPAAGAFPLETPSLAYGFPDDQITILAEDTDMDEVDDYFAVTSIIPGDADGDGGVDLDDYNLVSGSMYTTGVTGGPLEGDFNFDGAVDFEDFVTMALWFGESPPPQFDAREFAGDQFITIPVPAETLAEVPEPATGVLLLGVLGAAMMRRTRMGIES